MCFVEMVTEGNFEMATEDEFCDLGTEVSTDDETYELETEEETSETEEETYEYESGAEAEAKETAKDEIQYDEVRDKRGLREKINGSKPRDIRRYCCQICGLVRSKRNRLKIHIMSHHSIEVDTESKIDKFIEKKTPEDCKILESEVKESRKTEINGSKPRDIRRYCCQICGLIRAKRKRLKVHIMLHHGVEIDTAEIDQLIEKKNPEDCEMLESEAKKSRKVENDGFEARGLRSYCCVLCGLIRSKRKLLKNHIILEHREEADTKDEMDKFIEKRHSENDKRRYSCQICGVLRSKRVLLKFHVISSHGLEALKKDKRFASEGMDKCSRCVCNLCGMSFCKPSHLQQHKLSHSALEGLRHLSLLSTRWETALEESGY